MRLLLSWFALAGTALVIAACGRSSSVGTWQDGSVDRRSLGGAPGTGGGNTADTGGTVPSGTGSSVGNLDSGWLGTGGAVADASPDGGPADRARDGTADAPGEGHATCAPDAPLGTSRPAGDGCNTCICSAGGYWACTLLYCPPDAGIDAAVDPPAAADARRDLAQAESGALACAEISSQVECEARTDCHAVYVDYGNCGCDGLGCCSKFTECGGGGQADCKGPASCKMMPPTCEGPFVVAYLGSCYEGCVRASDCAM